VILRQRDHNSGWTSAADGTLEQRRYYCQNWRADVSAIVTSAGVMVEWAKFSAYGIPFGLPAGDTDSDGHCDQTDEDTIHAWAAAYDVRADYDLDGDIDSDDETLANANNASTGWNVLSAAAVANRIGYAGYQKDSHLDLNHVRNRVYSAELGRWITRDPRAYCDGANLYRYAAATPVRNNDPTGLASETCGPRRDEALKAWVDALRRCSESKGYDPARQPDIYCIECKEDANGKIPCGYTTPSINPEKPQFNHPAVVICKNAPADCDSDETLIHESQHLSQLCEYGFYSKPWEEFEKDWKDCDNTICQELQAYQSEGIETPGMYCTKACTSATGERKACYNNDKDGNPNPDREDNCYKRCITLMQTKKCQNGRHIQN